MGQSPYLNLAWYGLVRNTNVFILHVSSFCNAFQGTLVQNYGNPLKFKKEIVTSLM